MKGRRILLCVLLIGVFCTVGWAQGAKKNVVAGLANWVYVLGNLREVEHSNGHGALRTAADVRSPRGAGRDGR